VSSAALLLELPNQPLHMLGLQTKLFESTTTYWGPLDVLKIDWALDDCWNRRDSTLEGPCLLSKTPWSATPVALFFAGNSAIAVTVSPRRQWTFALPGEADQESKSSIRDSQEGPIVERFAPNHW